MKKIPRRKFLANSSKALAGSATFLASRPVDSSPLRGVRKKVSPNDRIAVALIGSGSQGKANLSAFLACPEVECLAVAEDFHLAHVRNFIDGLKGQENIRSDFPSN